MDHREVIKKGRQPIIKQNYQIKLQYFITDIQADKTLFIDLMLVNSKPYFISVLKPLKCVAVSKLIKRELYRLYLQQSYHILISLENTIFEFLYVELTVRWIHHQHRIEWFVSKVTAQGTRILYFLILLQLKTIY